MTVNTQQGTLRGQEKTSEYFSRRKYYSFQGIPFAKPPLGPLRFKVSNRSDFSYIQCELNVFVLYVNIYLLILIVKRLYGRILSTE